MLKDLITKEWHTDAEVAANAGGKAMFRGFYGKYELEIEHDGKKLTREIDFSKHSAGELKITL